MTRGIAFGVFDGLHEGHQHFLNDAAKECDELFVVIATSQNVEILKGHAPRHSYEERIRAISEFNASLKIMPSDPAPGTWEILDEIKPDIAFLGYDQLAIAEELKKKNMPYKILEAYRPEKYKSSLLK